MQKTSSSFKALRELVLVLLLVAVTGCEDSQRHLFTDTVDCTELPPLPSSLADESSLSETLLTDLGVGAARAVLRWEDVGGEDWFLTAETTAYILRAVDPATWLIGVDLPCTPAAATHVHFTSSDPTGDTLAPGDFTISAFGFDVPELEQGDDERDKEFDGTITVTSSSGEHASGFMSGHARTDLKSFVTQESLGIEVEVTALAFREVSFLE